MNNNLKFSNLEIELLSALKHCPSHTYEIVKRINQDTGRSYPLSTVYYSMNKLKRAGIIKGKKTVNQQGSVKIIYRLAIKPENYFRTNTFKVIQKINQIRLDF